MSFDSIVIIYNPNSTGPAEQNARQLQAILEAKMPAAVTLTPTEYAGHAIELAYDVATKYKQPLIISASGDGGYHEVINGALQAQAEGANPTCAVLPSGNANDHARTLHTKPLSKLILKKSTAHLDILQVSMVRHGKQTIRYAHSYVGIGITSQMAREFNKSSLTSWRETMIFFRTFSKLRPVRIRRRGKVMELDSLVCSMVPRMAKLFNLSKQAKLDDGKFEVATLPHSPKWKVARHMAKSVVAEIGARSRESDYKFRLLHKAPIQFDGEVLTVKGRTDVEISLRPGLLRTIA